MIVILQFPVAVAYNEDDETVLSPLTRTPNPTHPTARKVYVVTPTYARSTQQPDLTQLAQSLMLAQVPIHWILIEDSDMKTKWVSDLLNQTQLPHTHLTIMSDQDSECSGISQRNAALKWIKGLPHEEDGVIYFADDDNTYDYRLFSEVGPVPTLAIPAESYQC